MGLKRTKLENDRKLHQCRMWALKHRAENFPLKQKQ